MIFLHIYIYIYTFFFHILVTFGYVYIYIYLLVLNAKHENVIRCPVLLASDEVMKFIFSQRFPFFPLHGVGKRVSSFAPDADD